MIKQKKVLKEKIITPKQGKKIIVVDDDLGILDAVSLILEDAGYTTLAISDGNKVFKKIEKFTPDIILLDVLLSGTDGRVLCRQLKDDPQTKAIPIVMISAHPTAKLTIKEYGANAFLPKPFEAKELLKIIEKYIHSS